ncbi:hypothetical protein CMQ_2784 [Grosmannia clavigera kw1407]|uniref:DUF7614 domain-containing protein n=1 Tax=Grosmannia clavigera (strain kw1407 / UAMH 11150) TaxID=655863 RepID=F0XHE9_GROCL|nr:uncharacterized protein CMQ_2784 [Grosmannia clavigera kw1407]EFX02855.1 hypothetical protein CMQ_2784 [Grosmannia clavigera kw1407]
MDRDHGTAPTPGPEDNRSRKGRLMGKLFGGRDRKVSNELRGDDAELNAFLHGTSNSPSPLAASTGTTFDTFQVTHSTPPQLAKLDTQYVSRYPNALPVDRGNSSQQSLPSSQQSRSPPPSYSVSKSAKRNRKGLVVRFADSYPDIIGEGGDETEAPPMEIGKRRRARAAKLAVSPLLGMHSLARGIPTEAQPATLPIRSPLPGPPTSQRSILQQSQLESQQPAAQPPLRPQQSYLRPSPDDDSFLPRPLRRTQTGFSAISVPRRSFIEVHQAEMREAEGRALANALRAGVSPPSSPEVEQKRPPSPSRRSPAKGTPPLLPPPRHPEHRGPINRFEFDPTSPSAASPLQRMRSERHRPLARDPSPASDSPPTPAVERPYNAFRRDAIGSVSVKDRGAYALANAPRAMQDTYDAAQSASDEAFTLFVTRMRHLFELFRLHSETPDAVDVGGAGAGGRWGRELAEGLGAVGAGVTCRVLRFPTVADLHAVQAAITGYEVVFDGMAATFAIARRRMVVPIHKKWEAGTTRIQVVVQPDTKVTQLLAFFQDFHYGQCMGFVLKGTDVFEAFSRSGKAGLKIDDAKFPLPRMRTGDSGANGSKEGGSDFDETAFVCLDMPDLPGEHDDISILFQEEAGKLTTALKFPSVTHALTMSRTRSAGGVSSRTSAKHSYEQETLRSKGSGCVFGFLHLSIIDTLERDTEGKGPAASMSISMFNGLPIFRAGVFGVMQRSKCLYIGVTGHQ